MQRQERELRIIGGTLRGRRWRFADVAGLRPTPDRVRETLFNWLMNQIDGARVLDLFAGSGALAFEALSRGAVQAVLVESQKAVVQQLRETAEQFRLQAAAEIMQADALSALASLQGPFDVIFLDPPFDSQLLPTVLEQLARRQLRAPNGFCYVELPRGEALPPLPVGWSLHRSGTAGEVGYHLLA